MSHSLPCLDVIVAFWSLKNPWHLLICVCSWCLDIFAILFDTFLSYQGCTLVLSVGFWTHDLMIILITWNSKIFSCLHFSVILWTLRIPLSLSDPSPMYSAFLGIVSFHLVKIFKFRSLYNLYQLPLSAILDLSVSIELFIRDLFVRCSSCASFRTWLMCLALILLQSICLPLGSWLREYETNQHRTERKTKSTPP